MNYRKKLESIRDDLYICESRVIGQTAQYTVIPMIQACNSLNLYIPKKNVDFHYKVTLIITILSHELP